MILNIIQRYLQKDLFSRPMENNIPNTETTPIHSHPHGDKWSNIQKYVDDGDIVLAEVDEKSGSQDVISGVQVISWRECFLIFGVYLLTGTLGFSYWFDQWRVVDSLYFSVVTFTTVGYGDLSPSTDSGRLFAAFYAFSSVLLVSIALGYLAEKMVAVQEEAVEKAQQLLNTQVFDMFCEDENDNCNDDMKSSDSSDTEDSIYEAIFKDEDDTAKVSMLIRAAILVLLGGGLIGYNSGMNIIETIYFTTITMTTVGYGDLTPSDNIKWFSILFIPCSVGAMGYVLSELTLLISKHRIENSQSKVIRQHITLRKLQAMDTDHDGKVDMVEFLEFMLLALEKIDKDTLEQIKKQFRRLDIDQSGSLDKADLVQLARKTTKRRLQKRSRQKAILS